MIHVIDMYVCFVCLIFLLYQENIRRQWWERRVQGSVLGVQLARKLHMESQKHHTQDNKIRLLRLEMAKGGGAGKEKMQSKRKDDR
jgi:hypothetical protein